jgi:hypothetical protein
VLHPPGNENHDCHTGGENFRIIESFVPEFYPQLCASSLACFTRLFLLQQGWGSFGHIGNGFSLLLIMRR